MSRKSVPVLFSHFMTCLLKLRFMKNTRRKAYHRESPDLYVSATLDEIKTLENLVEKLAYRRTDTGLYSGRLLHDWEAVNTCSIEAFAGGYIFLSNNAETITLPFTNSFFFTCIREKDGENKLCWSSSLS